MLISPSQIIIQSVQFYKTHWRQMAPYMLLLFLPTVIVQCLGIIGIYTYALVPSLTWAPKVIIAVVLAAAFVFNIWVAVAMARGTKMLLRQEPGGDNWQNIFNTSSHLIWPAFFTAILIAVTVLLGLILFVVPGIIFTVWYNFGYYSAIFENKKGFGALAYSKQLVMGRWWAVCLRLLAPFVLFIAIGGVLRYIITAPLGFLPFSAFAILLIQGLFATIINVLMAPLFYSSGLILFLNAKETPVETTPQI